MSLGPGFSFCNSDVNNQSSNGVTLFIITTQFALTIHIELIPPIKNNVFFVFRTNSRPNDERGKAEEASLLLESNSSGLKFRFTV